MIIKENNNKMMKKSMMATIRIINMTIKINMMVKTKIKETLKMMTMMT